MAYKQKMSVRDGAELESVAVAAERADVVNSTIGLRNMKTVSVDRINYGDMAVEIPTVEIDHVKLGRPVDKRYEHNRQMVLDRILEVGVHAATVINFRPHILVSSSVIEILRKTKVAPPKDDQEFGFHIFTKVELEPYRPGQDSPLCARDHHPITLAKEYEKAYEELGGGVFAFVGLPEDIKNPNWIHRERYEQEKEKALKRMSSEVKEATGFWNTRDHRDSYRIADHHRASARRMKHLGYIANLPEWVEKQRDLEVKIPTCQKCQRPSEPNSAVCTNQNCNYIIDPRRAFEINDIDENHPSLERLTRAEVEEMGISDYVAETADEKPERLKARAPKPLSKVAMEVMRQQEEYEQSQKGN